MIELQTINDINSDSRQILQYATIAGRIEEFLENMNIEPIKNIRASFNLGSGDRETYIFHPSDVGSINGKSNCGNYHIGCSRKLYYNYIGVKPSPTVKPRNRRIFDTGTAIHTQLQSYLTEIAKLSGGHEHFVKEAEINPKYNDIADIYDITGHTDGVYTITEASYKLRFGVEIKTINTDGYAKTLKPHPEHVTQGTIYQKCLDLPIMLFLYYNKNDSHMVEFPILFNQNHWNAIVDKLNMVRKDAIEEQPSKQEVGWYCVNCPFKPTCNPPRRTNRPNTKTIAAFRVH